MGQWRPLCHLGIIPVVPVEFLLPKILLLAVNNIWLLSFIQALCNLHSMGTRFKDKMIFSVKYFFLNRFVFWASFYSHMMVFTYHDHICWKSDQGGRAWDMAFLWMKGGKFWKLAQRFWFEMSLWRQKRIFNPEKFQFIYSK